VRAGQLTGDDDVVILDQALDSDSALRVVLQAIRHNRIRDLITDFIGMAIADLLTCDNLAHFLFPFRWISASSHFF
jgi:hypothetical protein